MKKYILSLSVLLMAVMVGLSSCSDNDDNGTEQNGTTGGDAITLNNQFVYQEEIKNIQSVLRFDKGYTAVFYLSPTANIQDIAGMRAANDYLKLALPTGRLGLNTDFSQPGLQVEYGTVKLESGKGAKGPMIVSVTEEMVEIKFDIEAGQSIACQYKGNYQHQISENLFTVSTIGSEPSTESVLAAFRTQPKGKQNVVTFALGNIACDTPNGLSAGKYTLMFSVPQAHFDGNFHTFKTADGYQFYLIDNAKQSFENEVTEGRFRVTGKSADEKMHLVFEATLADGSSVAGDYYGALTDVNDIDILPATNTYSFVGAYGENEEKGIMEVLYLYDASKKLHKFGFKYDEYQEFGGYPPLVEIVLSEDVLGMVNADLATTPGWKINYNSFQVEYIAPDDPNAQYKDQAKGMITVVKVGENYRFNITAETEPKNAWSKAAKLSLSYEGPVKVVE